ncbi:hypothetical protein EJ05DRAFT_483223 [Pseudovirgaria hyperparasitica]|uniref:Uncharacterized protein n=1 Tax=Pseudovirgaria hyperparasitica TaxID=470096 RepID=A0A6A6WDI8_9PEZI|nr:uncharacterized protein EJ05DRAFT_483223 [Pseudovirgaria hyperparasitica]KAF2760773.1 hypothetical protein EJ05DRAFT_483223 [Pseudovirgaria hyperparasitica]
MYCWFPMIATISTMIGGVSVFDDLIARLSGFESVQAILFYIHFSSISANRNYRKVLDRDEITNEALQLHYKLCPKCHVIGLFLYGPNTRIRCIGAGAALGYDLACYPSWNSYARSLLSCISGPPTPTEDAKSGASRPTLSICIHMIGKKELGESAEEGNGNMLAVGKYGFADMSHVQKEEFSPHYTTRDQGSLTTLRFPSPVAMMNPSLRTKAIPAAAQDVRFPNFSCRAVSGARR